MSADVYDITICPVCNGMATIVDGQKMYNNKVYEVRKPCPNMKCHHGRMGVLRAEDNTNEVDYEVKPFPA